MKEGVGELGELTYMHVDMANLTSVKRFAEAVQEEKSRLDGEGWREGAGWGWGVP